MSGFCDKDADACGVGERMVGAVRAGDQGRQEAGRW